MCPRCSRQSGTKFIKRVLGWLAVESHGDLFTLCLTQTQHEGEKLYEARRRMERKAKVFLKDLKRHGLIAGMVATHIISAKSSDAWHYHIHLMLELPEGKFSEDDLLDRWQGVALATTAELVNVTRNGTQCRLVVPAGPAVPELLHDSGQAEFWDESPNKIAAALQYPIRDACQGIGAARLGGDEERMRDCAEELLRVGGGWKLRRTLGRWRRAVNIDVAKPLRDKLIEEGKIAAKPKKESRVCVGRVVSLYRKAVLGDFEAKRIFARLETKVRNSSEYAKRFLTFCRFAQTKEAPA